MLNLRFTAFDPELPSAHGFAATHSIHPRILAVRSGAHLGVMHITPQGRVIW
jgi:hypothetical protein